MKEVRIDPDDAEHIVNLFKLTKLASEQPRLKVIHDVALAELDALASDFNEQLKPDEPLVPEKPYMPESRPVQTQALNETNRNRRV